MSAVTGPVNQIGQQLPVTLTLPDSTYATVRGRVVAADGQTPIEGLDVQVRFGVNTILGVTTPADGRFETRVVLGEDGAVRVRVLHPNSTAFTELERTATAQGEVIDLGDITLPVSVLKGTVTYGGVAPVPYPSVFATRGDGQTEYPQVTRENGTYAFYGVPAGDYTVTANDDNGLEGTVAVTVATAESVVSNADIQLPALATLNIDVVDRDDSSPRYVNVIVRAGSTFERNLGWSAETVEGSSFTVTVPLGEVSVEAEVLTCVDPNQANTCSGVNGAAFANIDQAGSVFDVTVDLSSLGSVTLGGISLPGGAPVTGPIEVSWLGQPHPSFLTPQRYCRGCPVRGYVARESDSPWPDSPRYSLGQPCHLP